jgi:hypothetical protein
MPASSCVSRLRPTWSLEFAAPDGYAGARDISSSLRFSIAVSGDDEHLAARLADAAVGTHEANRGDASVESDDDVMRDGERLDRARRPLGLRDMDAAVVFGGDRT